MFKTRISKTIAILFVLLFAGIAWGGYTAETAEQLASGTTPVESEYVEGQVIVVAKLPDKTKLSAINLEKAKALVEKISAQYAEGSDGNASPFISVSRNSDKIVMLVASRRKTTKELIEFFKGKAWVLSVTPNYKQKKNTVTSPNDPYYKNGTLWGLSKINAPSAWSYTNGSADCIVAVVDSGMDYEHEDLKGNCANWLGDYAGSSVIRVLDRVGTLETIKVCGGFNDSSQAQKSDMNYVYHHMGDTGEIGHGTHCAGIVGAVGNNGKGVTGVCQKIGLVNVSMLCLSSENPLKVESYFTNAEIMKSFDIIGQQKDKGLNVRVVSCSFGGSVLQGSEKTKEQLETDAYYLSLKNLQDKGIIVCVAAGNDGMEIGGYYDVRGGYKAWFGVVPAYYAYHLPSVLSVGNITSQSKFASSSNYGNPYVEIAAPGTNIMSTLSKYKIQNNTVSLLSQSGYASYTGTSMATPCVAGCSALLLSYFPGKTAQEIVNLLTATATKENTKICAYGTVNIGAAMQKALQKWTVSVSKAQTCLASGNSETVTATADENTGIEWTSSDENIAKVDENGKISAINAGVAKISAKSKKSGFSDSCEVTVLEGFAPTLDKKKLDIYEGETETIKATAVAGTVKLTSSDEKVATIAADGKITAVSAGTAVITATSESGDTAECTITVSDPTQPVFVTKEITVTQGQQRKMLKKVLDKITISSDNEDVISISEDGTITAKETGTATVTAIGPKGGKAQCVVTVKPYNPKLDMQEFELPVGEEQTVTVATYDGSIVKWSCDSPETAEIEICGNKITIKGIAVGKATITATAENGNSTECTVNVIEPEKTAKSSTSGCNAGCGALLLLLVPVAVSLKKRF